MQARTYERCRFDFTQLVEFADPNGEVYLRASDEAINVLIGALDIDVESAQIAAEIKLDNLIQRGNCPTRTFTGQGSVRLQRAGSRRPG